MWFYDVFWCLSSQWNIFKRAIGRPKMAKRLEAKSAKVQEALDQMQKNLRCNTSWESIREASSVLEETFEQKHTTWSDGWWFPG